MSVSDSIGISLHGFLSGPSEAPGARGLRLQAPDLFRAPWDWRSEGLDEAGARVNELGGKIRGARLLLGYSLGARVAMHALTQARPGFWAGAVFISGHPGLRTELERRERIASDEVWAERFEGSESWASLMDSWNAQGVFMGGSNRTQTEQPELRPVYASVLRNGSLGRQRDLRSDLRESGTPMLWITGERDTKFSSVARELGFGKHVEVAGAGHRVAADRPKEIENLILKFHQEVRG